MEKTDIRLKSTNDTFTVNEKLLITGNTFISTDDCKLTLTDAQDGDKLHCSLSPSN